MSDWRDQITKQLRAYRERVHDLSGVGYVCPSICEIAADEIERLRSALSTAREEGFRAGRLAGLAEAEIKIADLNAQASGAWVNPTLADQAYIEGRAECVEIIRALKEKQP